MSQTYETPPLEIEFVPSPPLKKTWNRGGGGGGGRHQKKQQILRW